MFSLQPTVTKPNQLKLEQKLVETDTQQMKDTIDDDDDYLP